jgi:hypothetical protein
MSSSHFLDRPAHLHAGVVDEHVDRPERFGARHRGGHARVVEDIQRHDVQIESRRFRLFQRTGFARIAQGRDDAGALAGEVQRREQAEAAAAAGDQHGFGHRRLLSFWNERSFLSTKGLPSRRRPRV